MSPSIRKSNPGGLVLPGFWSSSVRHKLTKREERVSPPPAYYDEDLPSTLPSVDLDASNDSVSPNTGDAEGVVIKGEEVCIILILLFLWVGAIALFFNRWGKIRMLEPYQPKFCEAHRASCPIATDVAPLPHFPRSCSKYNLSLTGDGSPHFAKCTYHGLPSTSGIMSTGGGGSFLTTSAIIASSSRPRQNSVFVTSAHSPASASANLGTKLKNTSRKAKSAIDLSTLILSEEFFESVRRNSKNSVTHL